MPNSYKPEVIADASGKWVGNALRFKTEEEAQRSVDSLQARWFLVTDTRVTPSDDPPNYEFPPNATREVKLPTDTP